jgi:hypothetical protein
MAISSSIYDDITKGKVLRVEEHNYEFDIGHKNYLGFEHLTFETGLQLLTFDYDDSKLDEHDQLMSMLNKAYSLDGYVRLETFSNWIYLEEWKKLNYIQQEGLLDHILIE